MQDAGKQKHTILYTTSFATMAGGGQWSLYYLIKHLDKNIFHPIVLCPMEGELAEKMREAGANIIFLKMGRIRHLNPFVIKKLISIIKYKNISLAHTDSTTETFYAGIAAKIAGIPLIWHIRVSEGKWFLDRILPLFSTRLILVADALKERFRWLKSQKMPTVYNGIDIDEFDSFPESSSIRKRFCIDESTILLACIGRIEDRKGQEYLIHSMKDINNAKLIIVGREDEKYLERIKRKIDELKISDRIFFTGYRKDIPSILKEIDILVFPVISGEGFSRTILEAMAAGKPVIATDNAGNPEAVVDGITGYIVPIKDAMALADKINKLVSNKEKREQMGMSGRKRVEEIFTIEKNVNQIERLYLEVLGNEYISRDMEKNG